MNRIVRVSSVAAGFVLLAFGLRAGSFDPTADPTADGVLEGEVTFSAASGTTVTYSGKYTGTGTAVITGGGTVIFSNAGNAYSGGTYIKDAVFQVNATGAAGTGTISNMNSYAHVFINCPRLKNNLYYKSNYANCHSSSIDKRGGFNPFYPMVDTVLEGSVTFDTTGMSYFASGYGTSGDSGGYDWNNIEISGDVTSRGAIGIALFGDVKIDGRLVCVGSLNCNPNWRCKGKLTLGSATNSATRLLSYNGTFVLTKEDALPNTELFWDGGSYLGTSTSPLLSAYYLCGKNQTFPGLNWKYNIGWTGEKFDGWGLYAGSSAADTAPATVRFTGKGPWNSWDTSYDILAGLFGNLTYVLDAPSPTVSWWYQNFTNRCSTTTGDLIISNGDFRVTGTATFPNVPKIYVGTGGRFTCTSTRVGAFGSCTNLTVDGKMTFAADVPAPFSYKKMALTLGANAQLTLPTADVVTVPYLKIGDTEISEGTTVSAGTYPQLKAGTVRVETAHARVTATWTGNGGADEAATTAANWSTAPTAPSFSDHTLDATFASGGSRAAFAADAALYGLTLNSASDFTLAGEGTTLALREGGLAVTGTPADATTYTVEPQVRYMTADTLNLALPSSVTLDLAGGFRNDFIDITHRKTGDGALKVGGKGFVGGSFVTEGGSFESSADCDWTSKGKFIVSNETTILSGTVDQDGGVISGAWDKYNAMADYFQALRPKATSQLTFNGFTCGKRFYQRQMADKTGGSRSSYDARILFAAGTTNEFKAHAHFSDPSNISFGPGAEAWYDKGMATDSSVYYYVTGGDQWGDRKARVVYRQPVTSLGGGGDGQRFANGITVRFESTGNYVRESTPSWNRCYQFWAWSRCELAVDNVFPDDKAFDWQIRFEYHSTLNLGATSQYVSWLCMSNLVDTKYKNYMTPFITGEPGCRLRVKRGFIQAQVLDAATIVCEGTDYAKELTVGRNSLMPYDVESPTEGDVEVKSGLMHYETGISWPNVKNVIVHSATAPAGKLQLDAAVFGKKPNFRIDIGATVVLAEGVRQRCGQLWIGGQRMEGGEWGAVGSGAEHESSVFSGAGRLIVRPCGVAIVVR